MEEWFGVPVRVLPSWSVPVNLAQIKSGKAVITSGGLSQGSLALACEGQSAFASEEWGPQRIMAIWQDYPCPYGILVRGDSEITELTADQIRGKKMSWYDGSPGWQLAAEGCVRFAGLTLDDVQLIDLGGYSACARAVAEGKTDFAYIAPISTVTFEVVENPFGIRYLPMPFANKEGWKRYSEVDKYRGPAVCTAGVEEALGIEMDYAPFTASTYQDMDEELIYQITKFFGEAYDLYKDKHARNVGRRIEDMPATIEASCIPFHPGAVRYFKEVGIWTDEYEKWNNERTSWFDRYEEAWDKALDAAYPKKIRTDYQDEEWLALWETYRYGIPRFSFPLR
jgi:TRAP transporter TAXI family solute receptor